MTKISGMAKVLVLTLIFVLMSLTQGLNVKAEDDDGTLPGQGTVPMSTPCVLHPGKCYGKIYTVHVGDRTYQNVSINLLLWFDETVRVEIDDVVYTSESQQGNFTIEADRVETAFFKVLNANGDTIYIADWTREDRNTNCFFFDYNPNYQGIIERYAVVAPEHTIVFGNHPHEVRNNSFIWATTTPEIGFFVYQTASRVMEDCIGGGITLEPFTYAMKYRNYLSTVQGE